MHARVQAHTKVVGEAGVADDAGRRAREGSLFSNGSGVVEVVVRGKGMVV